MDVEIVNTIINGITAAAVIGGAISVPLTAFFTFKNWKKEYIGRSDIKLAREVKFSFIKIKSVIMSAFPTIITGEELRSIQHYYRGHYPFPKDNKMMSSDISSLASALAPKYRLEQQSDEINNFGKVVYKACAYWNDNEIYNYYKAIDSIIRDIIIESEYKHYYRSLPQEPRHNPEEGKKKTREEKATKEKIEKIVEEVIKKVDEKIAQL